MIFGAETKSPLCYKNCSTCTYSIAKHNGVSIPPCACYKNWGCPTCAMEANIIMEWFKQSETLHDLQYVRIIGDSDSSVHHAVRIAFPSYGCLVQMLDCVSYAVKCYRSNFQKLAEDNSKFKGRNRLTYSKMQ